MMDINLLLILLGGILILGVLGNFLFSKTRVPTPVILILLGMLLGPITHWIPASGVSLVAPHFGTIALILILFEGGLELDIEQAAQQFGGAALLGLLYFGLCVAGVYGLIHYVYGVSWKTALMSGFVLGGTSPVVILPTVGLLSLSKEFKTFLVLETSVTEVLTVVTVVLFMDVLRSGDTGLGHMALHVLRSGALSVLIAAIAAVIWTRVIFVLAGAHLSYMLTLGLVFVLYAMAGLLGAEPALTILSFGLILGNAHLIAVRLGRFFPSRFRHLRHSVAKESIETLNHVNVELSFLVRTFFMVALGLVFDFSRLTPALLIAALAVLIYLVAARWAAVRTARVLSTTLRSLPKDFASLAMLPRGLACAVMAMTASRAGLPKIELLVTLAFVVILGTNLVMTWFVVAHERTTNRSI